MTNSVKRIFASILLLLTIGCGEDEPNPCERKLKDQPLDIIQNCIQGRWNFHQSTGGFTGFFVVNYTDSFIEFKDNDSVYWWHEGAELTNTKIEWEFTENLINEVTHIMRINSQSMTVQGIDGDTLLLHDVVVDGFSHKLIRD